MARRRSTSSRSLLRKCGYDLTAEISKRLLAIPEDSVGFRLQPSAIFAPGYARGEVVNVSEALAWEEGLFAGSDKAEALAVSYFADTMRQCAGGECFANPYSSDPLTESAARKASAATLVSVLLPVNPSSADGDRFITQARLMLDEIEREPHGCKGLKIKFHLADSQATVVNHDLMVQTFHEFKRVLPIVMALIFIMIGFFLRSAFVPLRLAMTLALPLCSVYGMAVLVYQGGILDWLGWSSVTTSGDGSFHWEVPIFAFALTMALALDYDLFVVIRIADYRFAGYTLRGSIVRALHETAPIVMGAGLMMAISFGGNLLAEATTLNQAGWILSTGVLLDTFVVRMLMVPALLSFADKAAWWPSKPPTTLLLDEFNNVERSASEPPTPLLGSF